MDPTRPDGAATDSTPTSVPRDPTPTIEEPAERLNAALGRPFADGTHLRPALAHRSWCAEHAEERSNERLEFLGDAVLGVVVTDHIFRAFPQLPEGEMAKVRSAVVSAAALSEVAAELSLGDAVLLGKGEAQSGGREKPSILADALEAVFGAIYLHRGWDVASEVILGLLRDRISEAAAGPGGQDYKTRLQELVTRLFAEVPRYQVVDEGPDHAKVFHAEVHVGGQQYGTGEGRSKKQAEAAAARAAWQRLRTEAETEADTAEGTNTTARAAGTTEERDA